MSYQGMQAPDFTVTTRLITPAERTAAEASLRPLRNNARGMAVMSIIMAVLVQFTYELMLVLVPLFFGLAGLGLAFQARKGAVNLGKALSSGTVAEIRATPRKAGIGRGLSFGPVGLMQTRELSAQLSEGVPASISVMPETKSLLAVNGVPLKRPLQLGIAPGTDLGALARSQDRSTQAMPVRQPAAEELPPPPEGWTGDVFCTRCGQKNSPMARFCQKCGATVVKP